MASPAEVETEGSPGVADRLEDKRVVFQLLEKFDLSVGDVAQVFSLYLQTHTTDKNDLNQLRSALKARATAEQARIIEASGELLTGEQVAKQLGYESRQTVNNKKRAGELLSVSFPNRRGDFFPSCQFEGPRIRPWVPKLLKYISGWSALAFLTARYESLGGKSYLDVLLADSSRAAEMLEAAEEYIS